MSTTVTRRSYPLCSVSDLSRSGSFTAWVEELRDEISAFYVDGKIYVYSTVCPHFGGDFDFDRQSCHLTCRWHGWKFDVQTGKSLTELESYQPRALIRRILERGNNQPLGCFPYKGQLRSYEYAVNDDQLEVLVDESN